MEYEARGTGSQESKTIALKDINLNIYQNEIVTLIGPSGCGKTTLLLLIAGLLTPTDGTIKVDGNLVARPSNQRAVVFQEDAVFPWLTVEGNIEYGLKLKGVPKDKRNEVTDHYIDLVGLDGFEDAYPRELSGGMKKRVDLARCYANDPSILLMDEPFGSLDVFTKQKMQEELLRLWGVERKTICFVTHDIEEAIFLGQRTIVLSARPGQIHRKVDVPFGKEREFALREKEEFQSLRGELWNEIATQTESGGTR